MDHFTKCISRVSMYVDTITYPLVNSSDRPLNLPVKRTYGEDVGASVLQVCNLMRSHSGAESLRGALYLCKTTQMTVTLTLTQRWFFVQCIFTVRVTCVKPVLCHQEGNCYFTFQLHHEATRGRAGTQSVAILRQCFWKGTFCKRQVRKCLQEWGNERCDWGVGHFPPMRLGSLMLPERTASLVYQLSLWPQAKRHTYCRNRTNTKGLSTNHAHSQNHCDLFIYSKPDARTGAVMAWADLFSISVFCCGWIISPRNLNIHCKEWYAGTTPKMSGNFITCNNSKKMYSLVFIK